MNNYEQISASWDEILDLIRSDPNIADVSFNTWIKPLKLKAADDEGVTLFVPNGSMAINILNKKRYTYMIRSAIAEVTGLTLSVHYSDHEEEETDPKPYETDASFMELLEKSHLNSEYSFDSFVVGPNNKFAHSAALAVAEAPGEIYNPLYLYGGVGLGKTHLMHSIGQMILRNDPHMRVRYVTSEVFTNELIESIRNGNNSAMSKFRDKYRNIDVLMIDDIQFIMGKESTQEEFFHTFEALYGARRQIVVSSDKPPQELDILEERIRSRLAMGLCADIHSPNYEEKMAILRKKQEDEGGIQLDDSILDFIANHIHSNIRELEGALNKVRAYARIEKDGITLSQAEIALHDYIVPEENRQLTSEEIIAVVAEHFDISIEDIRSKKRQRKFVYPRSVAMYLCRELTEDSLQQIANKLGKDDHSTAIAACRRIEEDIDRSTQARMSIDAIRKKLGS